MAEVYKKLTLRLNAKEYAHLQEQAEISGLKIEPMLRRLIMGMQLKPHPPDNYAKLLFERVSGYLLYRTKAAPSFSRKPSI